MAKVSKNRKKAWVKRTAAVGELLSPKRTTPHTPRGARFCRRRPTVHCSEERLDRNAWAEILVSSERVAAGSGAVRPAAPLGPRAGGGRHPLGTTIGAAAAAAIDAHGVAGSQGWSK